MSDKLAEYGKEREDQLVKNALGIVNYYKGLYEQSEIEVKELKEEVKEHEIDRKKMIEMFESSLIIVRKLRAENEEFHQLIRKLTT